MAAELTNSIDSRISTGLKQRDHLDLAVSAGLIGFDFTKGSGMFVLRNSRCCQLFVPIKEVTCLICARVGYLWNGAIEKAAKWCQARTQFVC